jgi:mannose-6-phosphate isomerase-like protein (cupin superfamily)
VAQSHKVLVRAATMPDGCRGRRAGGSPARGGSPILRRVITVEKLADRTGGVTSRDFVLVEWTAELGDHWIAPLHVHHSDDEAWYVLEGELGFRLDDEVVIASPGSAVVAPRGTAHTYWNAGAVEARYVLVMSTRIAQLIEAIHTPGADIPAVFAEHDSELLSLS